MADEKPAAERKIPPTPEKLRKARREGQIAHSRELPTVAMLFALIVALHLLGPGLLSFFKGTACHYFSNLKTTAFDGRFARDVLAGQASLALEVLTPIFLVAAAAAIFSSLVPGGATFATRAVRVNMKAISIVSGTKRLFSMKSAAQLIMSVAKLSLLMVLAYFYLSRRIEEIALLWGADPGRIVCGVGALAMGLAFRMAAALLVLAIGDCLYQRWQYMRDLRMTAQEVKEERKEHEGNPQVKARIRSIQMQVARKRMLSGVKEADVVVVNPTHVAVALRYDPPDMQAPMVVAKAKNLLAEKVKEIARSCGVPIVERPELARTLYETVEVGQQIPEELYVVVANVLALIYRNKSPSY